jgi:predicted hotdog family 3-hydroxylacyl-ACP dehydratase
MDIKSIIPQREPIIMIDNIINHSEEVTTTSLTILSDNIFVEDGFFQSSGLIEHIAQSSAARMGIQTVEKGIEPLLGYIASIKNMRIERLPKVGEIIATKIIITNQIGNIIVVQGKSKVKDTVIVNCALKIFIEM